MPYKEVRNNGELDEFIKTPGLVVLIVSSEWENIRELYPGIGYGDWMMHNYPPLAVVLGPYNDRVTYTGIVLNDFPGHSLDPSPESGISYVYKNGSKVGEAREQDSSKLRQILDANK